MEPRIQYAKTKDGVSIAFYTLGEGVPFVWLPEPPFSHIQREWQYPIYRVVFDHLAARTSLVRFDARGLGLSDRDVDDFSLDSRMLDLKAVVDSLGFETFVLGGVTWATPLAIAYAASHPERVSRLLLVNGTARAEDIRRFPRYQALMKLFDADWEMYTENVASVSFGWGREEARHFAEHLRACVTRDAARRYFSAMAAEDVTDSLAQVIAPTLLIHLTGLSFLGVDTTRKLAASIPNAQMVVLEGDYRDSGDAVLSAVDEFLGEGEEAKAAAELPEGMAVLLFADIAESTALTEQLGDSAFRAKARDLDTSLRAIIRECAGTPVEGKVLGDGVLAVFTSARQAIDCALRCDAASAPLGLQLHLGIHAGDVIREGNNVYGGAVNIAARIAAASEPGEVLVSDTLRGLARTSAGVTFDDCGEHELKGVGEPQRLFAVRGGG